ncbi:biotin--[acetyl-CoA-carboxylase] ligase [Novosphingobium capsulatum]|uniref:biotin--[acetyl-CoA-carboxylase] ligase n=1 Tax=Novosphingobium capsulatum TaxID=13688 RepID=UPI00286D2740|nr:biotin--[acetyl-CoA-carboxylase] ligase [Novosphingobium capsulatum]
MRQPRCSTWPEPLLLEYVKEIPSTNAALVARAGGGDCLLEGHWLIADRQSAGRGRSGRVWSDGFGNFMGSTAVQLASHETAPQTLALVAGLALWDAVSSMAPGLPGLYLKWPNDLLVGQAKLAGILLERVGQTVVVGIGVNLAAAPDVPGRETVSLAALGHAIARDAFAAALASAWAARLGAWHAGQWPILRSAWEERAVPRGTLVSVNDRDHGMIMGAFAGIDADGVAQLRLADGRTLAIHAGDVDLVGDPTPPAAQGDA